MLQAAKNYLFLPSIVSDFEQNYLKRMNTVALWFFAMHLPVMIGIAYFNDTDPRLAFALTTSVLFGPWYAYRTFQDKRNISTVMGISAMLMGGLLVHFGQGPVQIEMHFYFFVLLALLAVFANPMVVVAAAVTAALHHALLWAFLPSSVFNYDAPFWVVAVHAAFVVLESVAACFIARSFFDNVIGLEKKVAERTAQVEARNRDMRMVLDSVKQGFFTIDAGGKLSEERSAAVEQLLGPAEPQDSYFDVLRRHDPKVADWTELGLDDVFAGFLPVEVTIDQLPSRIIVRQRTLSIEYSPIESDGTVQGLAVVISDITPEVERQALESETRELIAMIEGISNDRFGFMEFFQEAETIVEALRIESREDMVVVKRRLHTLKGNAAIFGMQRVADTCHAMEDHIEEYQTLPEGPMWTKLFGCWASVRGNLRRLVSDESGELRLTDVDYNNLLLNILNQAPLQKLATGVAAWRLEATETRLLRIAEQAKRLAARLGKGDINVRIEANQLKTEPAAWASFWSSLTHVIRNAVDHGIEGPEDRRLAHKSAVGTLHLSTYRSGDRFVVSIADDGRGVNWEEVRAAAERRGVVIRHDSDLSDVLFMDGLSTASGVTEVSGRGVGLGALKAEVEAMQGVISIQSKPGEGTEFRFSFPIEAMAPETHNLLASYGIEPTIDLFDSEEHSRIL